jgi:hypothetical protein
MIVDSVISNNTSDGIGTEYAAVVRLARSAVTGNVDGIHLEGGAVYSYQDNDINGNTTDIVGGSLTSQARQ